MSVDNNFLTGNARFGIGSSQSHGIAVYNNVVTATVKSGIAVSGSALTDTSGAPHPIPSRYPYSFGACVIRNTANDHRADGILASQGGDYAILENTCINNGVSGIELNNGAQITAMEGNIFENSIINGGLVREDSDVFGMTGGRVSNALDALGVGIIAHGQVVAN